MDYEEYERLLSDLEEAKGSFDILIDNMKEKGIDYPYDKLIKLVDDTVVRIKNALDKYRIEAFEYEGLYEDNRALIWKARIIKYSRGLGILLWFLVTSKLGNNMDNKVAGYFLGMALALAGAFGINMASENVRYKIEEEDKETKEELGRLVKVKGECKRDHDIASTDIETINSINRNLWNEMEKPIGLRLVREEGK